MMRFEPLAILILAVGCSVAGQLGVQRSASTTTAASATAANAAPGPSATPSSASTEPAVVRASGALTVPNVIGKTPEDARAIIKAAGFTSDVEITRIHCTATPDDPPRREGHVICQAPDPATAARSYTIIQISLATRDQDARRLLATDLKSVIGLSVDEARQRLKELGHTGTVTVRIVDNLVGCSADGRVCDYGPTAAMNQSDPLELIINRRKLDISAPAP